jgi:hypothetical protein
MSNRSTHRLPATRHRAPVANGLLSAAPKEATRGALFTSESARCVRRPAPGYQHGQYEEERVTIGGFSSKRLARVRDVPERHVDAGYVPGAVAVVARRGEVHIEATGSLAFEGAGSGTPMATDTICRVGSR